MESLILLLLSDAGPEFSTISDETLGALLEYLVQRDARENGVERELLGIQLAQEWTRRYPGVLPPHLAGRKLPGCFGKGKQCKVMN